MCAVCAARAVCAACVPRIALIINVFYRMQLCEDALPAAPRKPLSAKSCSLDGVLFSDVETRFEVACRGQRDGAFTIGVFNGAASDLGEDAEEKGRSQRVWQRSLGALSSASVCAGRVRVARTSVPQWPKRSPLQTAASAARSSRHPRRSSAGTALPRAVRYPPRLAADSSKALRSSSSRSKSSGMSMGVTCTSIPKAAWSR